MAHAEGQFIEQIKECIKELQHESFTYNQYIHVQSEISECALKCQHKPCNKYYDYNYNDYSVKCEVNKNLKFTLCRKAVEAFGRNTKSKSKTFNVTTLVTLVIFFVVVFNVAGIFIVIRDRTTTEMVSLI